MRSGRNAGVNRADLSALGRVIMALALDAYRRIYQVYFAL